MDAIPTFMFVEVSRAQEEAQRQIIRANAGGPAVAEISYVSTGSGQHRVQAVVEFPLAFKTEPHFTQGSGVIKNGSSTLFHDPIGTSGVLGWERDGDYNYTGARIWVRVDAHPIDEDILATGDPRYLTAVKALDKMQVRHFLTFSGEGVKAAPDTMPVDLPTRSVGW